jgi:hypothetical protein
MPREARTTTNVASGLRPYSTGGRHVTHSNYLDRARVGLLVWRWWLLLAKANVIMAHAAVWLDHREARIFRLASRQVDEVTVRTPQHVHRRHPKGESGAKEHPDDEKRFFHELVTSLAEYQHVLIVGPSTAKVAFVQYVHEHARALESRIDGVETVDHPTDGQVAALGKKFYKLDDD